MARVLVIEDDDDLRFSVHRAIRSAGHDAAEAASIAEADAAIAQADFDVIVTDVHLGENGDGVEMTGRLREQGFDGGVVVMTGFGSIDLAVRAMKLGADEFVEKPVKLDDLTGRVDRLLSDQRDRNRLRLYQRLEQSHRPDDMLGESQAWRDTLRLAERLASAPIVNRGEGIGSSTGGALPTVLLLGETGTGKGVIARHIHKVGVESDKASDSDAPFVHVNCSALPAPLVEAELFGHEKGAFTDARETRAGLFEMAEGGTVLLDEIGDLPVELQAKLLTVIERGVVRRVGGSSERTVRCRVIAATHRNLDEAVGDGAFRSDLLYRLNAFTIGVPPLRERTGDALLIARALLERFRSEYGREPATLTPEAEDTIAGAPWRGNVRELVNAIQRAAMLADGTSISVADLGLGDGPVVHMHTNGSSNGRTNGTAHTSGEGRLRFDFESGKHTAEEVERELMVQALHKTHGNVSRAARLIGMQRSSFRYRIERYGLDEIVKECAGR